MKPLTLRSLKRARQFGGRQIGVDRDQDRNAYNRKATRTYPYKSHGQYLRACYGLVSCGAMAFFNGWRSVSPFSAADFFASYISVRCKPLAPLVVSANLLMQSSLLQIIVFTVLSIAYHIKLQGFNPLGWSLYASEDLTRPVIAVRPDPTHPRGTFKWPHGGLREKVTEVCNWIWVWLK